MTLYSLRTLPSGYAITKFDDDLEVQSTYVMTRQEIPGRAIGMIRCSCPASGRPTCRHREMVPLFILTNRVDTGWFYDHDAMKWYPPIGEGKELERRL